MKRALFILAVLLAVLWNMGCYRVPVHVYPIVPPNLPEAPAGFDLGTNGFTDQPTMDAARVQFEEDAGDELGPFFNHRSCVDCHSNPVTGGNSQVTEHRIAPDDQDDSIAAATLIHDQAIPGFPQQVEPPDAVHAFRSSPSLLGSGFVEAVPDMELIAIAKHNGGQYILVPVLESPGKFKVGRFGHKDQHASLMSFAGDADCNEKGVTNRLVIPCQIPSQNTIEDQQSGSTATCTTPNCEDIDFYTAFMRSLKVPPRGPITAQVISGGAVFQSIGCAECHIPTLYTRGLLPRDVYIHPYGDFLLHNVGTGDGIQQGLAPANKVKTAALWGLRTKSRFLHDNTALTITAAIRRHGKEAKGPAKLFRRLSQQDRDNVLAFLGSL